VEEEDLASVTLGGTDGFIGDNSAAIGIVLDGQVGLGVLVDVIYELTAGYVGAASCGCGKLYFNLLGKICESDACDADAQKQSDNQGKRLFHGVLPFFYISQRAEHDG
jgi:hypothetical protein